MKQDEIVSVIGALYGAALEPARWPHALERLRQLFDGGASVVFLADRETGEVPVWLGVGTEAGEREYLDHVKELNPRVGFSMTRPPGVLAWDYRVLSEQEMRRDPFYDWLGRVAGCRYFVGTRMFDIGGRSAFTSLEWPKAHGHVERDTVRLYARIVPHIQQAFRLTLARAEAELHAGTFEAILDAFVCGVVLYDARGRLLHVNAQAEAVFARSDGLSLASGRLEALKAADTRKLHRLMKTVAHRTESGDIAPAASLAVGRRGGATPYVVTVVPLPVDPLPGPIEGQAIAAIIRESPAGRGPSPEQLSAVFGLTAREAALAAALGDGLCLRDAAGRLGISYNTARVHLRNVFLKTGVHSQPELARLLMQLASLGETGRETLDGLARRHLPAR